MTAPMKTKESGMTLIEIMVVVALISTILVVGGSRLGGSGRKMKQAVRRFAILGKDLHNKAKIFNKTYRIVINISEEGEHSYWVESSTETVKLTSDEQRKNLQKLTKLQRNGLIKDFGFSLDTRFFKKPVILPLPLKFKEVEFAQRSEAVKTGEIYIHFFPQGLVEESAIHITDGNKLNWTIAYHPVTGKADVVVREVALKDMRGYEE